VRECEEGVAQAGRSRRGRSGRAAVAAGVIRTMAPYLPMAPMLARAVEADGGLARGLDDNAEPVVEGEAEEANEDA
jgi:hypothetical protein